MTDVVPDWRTRAACLHSDPWLFSPDRAAGPTADQAKRVCADCPVRARCLDWALSHGAERGVWGGRTAVERQTMGVTSLSAQRFARRRG